MSSEAGNPTVSEPIIRVEGLGKKYLIRHQEGGARYRALRDVLADGVRSAFGLLRGLRPQARNSREEFWALKDVSFDIQEGDVVGIVGRNGAGKSTLLKILSRITEPTAGRVTLNGRVASLLEVGTGFHPELTGRENVYLNGSILGMKRKEIDRKFDEIVAFAEVEKFLDTPVKRYSSGMYVRLAFAVAAHLEPEVLVVDEVLAVGDAAFQKKSLGKMGEVAKQGRTVLFVSHNMAAVSALCQRAILLDGGRVSCEGPAPEVVKDYQKAVLQQPEGAGESRVFFNENEGIGITNFRTSLTENGETGLDLSFRLDVIAKKPCRRIGVGFRISTLNGLRVCTIPPGMTNYILDCVDGRVSCTFRCRSVTKHLAGGEYVVDVWLARPRIEWLVLAENAVQFSLPASDLYKNGVYYQSERHGIVPLPATFEVQQIPEEGCLSA